MMCTHYADYGDYGFDDLASDCVMAPLSNDGTAYVTAFYESPDVAVACSNGSVTSSSRVHVLSVTGMGRVARRRLPRIRVNIVSDAASNITSGMWRTHNTNLYSSV